jgi:hypothetical protein
MTRAWGAKLLVCGLLVLGGCGEEKFKNEPRPAPAIELTGVIQPGAVRVSPDTVGAGPILITISNQTTDPHTVTLSGESVEETVGPVQPMDTGTIQKTLAPGFYQVKAGSDRAVEKEIPVGQLTVGKKRPSSANQLLLP